MGWQAGMLLSDKGWQVTLSESDRAVENLTWAVK